MSTSFRPHQAREDNYVLGIVAAFIFSMVMLVLAFQTYHSGLKYIVLTATGIETQSSVLSIVNIGEFSTEDIVDMGMSISRDFTENIDDVTVNFTDHRGSLVVGSFFVPSSQNTLREGAELAVVYSRLKSEIFFPAQSLSSYRVDAWVFSITSGVIFLCSLSVVMIIWWWRAFRKWARRY